MKINDSCPYLVAFILACGCAGSRGAAPPPLTPAGSDETILTQDDGYREPPTQGAQRPPPTHLDEPAPARADAPPEAESLAPPDETPLEKGRVSFAGPRGSIPRTELFKMLDQSPAIFLRRVETEPRFESGRFRGWQIGAFFTGDARFSGIDLKRGDVVTRINGQPIEQPDQFIVVWQALRQARELRVDLLRDGKPHVARWLIAD